MNFFSYFTNLSNIMISIVFIVSALRLLPGRKDPSDSDVAIRGGAVVYIAFVGIVFNTILADVALGPLIPWVNVVLHMIVPIAGVVDWLLWAPRRRLPFRVVPWWMIWPAVYSVYSVTRGAIDGFYPYPFFNPEASGGYGGVALWCLVLILAFFILAVLVRWAGNLRHRSLTSPAAQSDGLPERAPRG
nr:Pr6Pr family membrane protein [Agrococcus sp. ARC_14]